MRRAAQRFYAVTMPARIIRIASPGASYPDGRKPTQNREEPEPMGYIVTMPGDAGPRTEPGVEVRRESVRLFQHYERVPPEVRPQIWANGVPTLSVEITKEYLSRILAFFDNPNNRALCGLEVPPPAPDGT
jgi:hypothetical protein